LVLPMSIFYNLVNWMIEFVKCLMSWHLSENESSLTKRALVVIFHWFFDLALYSKYASLNLEQTSSARINF